MYAPYLKRPLFFRIPNRDRHSGRHVVAERQCSPRRDGGLSIPKTTASPTAVEHIVICCEGEIGTF